MTARKSIIMRYYFFLTQKHVCSSYLTFYSQEVMHKVIFFKVGSFECRFIRMVTLPLLAYKHTTVRPPPPQPCLHGYDVGSWFCSNGRRSELKSLRASLAQEVGAYRIFRKSVTKNNNQTLRYRKRSEIVRTKFPQQLDTYTIAIKKTRSESEL